MSENFAVTLRIFVMLALVVYHLSNILFSNVMSNYSTTNLSADVDILKVIFQISTALAAASFICDREDIANLYYNLSGKKFLGGKYTGQLVKTFRPKRLKSDKNIISNEDNFLSHPDNTINFTIEHTIFKLKITGDCLNSEFTSSFDGSFFNFFCSYYYFGVFVQNRTQDIGTVRLKFIENDRLKGAFWYSNHEQEEYWIYDITAEKIKETEKIESLSS